MVFPLWDLRPHLRAEGPSAPIMKLEDPASL